LAGSAYSSRGRLIKLFNGLLVEELEIGETFTNEVILEGGGRSDECRIMTTT
jgi:hypothetical protein